MIETNAFFQLHESGDTAALQSALQANPALLEARDRMERTPLHQAVAAGKIELVKILLQAGADVSAADRQEETILYSAVEQDPAILTLLLDAGANPNQPAILNDTPLFNACDRNAIPQARLLIARGADVNAQNDFSQTPLHAAASAWHLSILDLLLESGAQIDARDWLGDTPLHCAVKNVLSAEDVPTCMLTIDHLLAAGADLNTVNNARLNVLQTARTRAAREELASALGQRGFTD